MDNHFHLLLHSPQEIPSEKNICERYKAFYDGKRVIFPGSPQCKDWQARLLKKAMHDVFDEVIHKKTRLKLEEKGVTLTLRTPYLVEVKVTPRCRRAEVARFRFHG